MSLFYCALITSLNMFHGVAVWPYVSKKEKIPEAGGEYFINADWRAPTITHIPIQ